MGKGIHSWWQNQMSKSEAERQHWACLRKSETSGGTGTRGTCVNVGHEAAQEGWMKLLKGWSEESLH